MFWKSSKIKIIKSFRAVNKALNDQYDIGINNSDLSETINSLTGAPETSRLFLERFTSENLFSMMYKVGLIEHLNSMGFNNLIVDIDHDKNRISYMKIFYDRKTVFNQLIELRVSELTFIPDKKNYDETIKDSQYDMIVIEWLSARNPIQKFEDDKPQLPGQTSPGLGVLKYCFKMLSIMAQEVFKDGFLDVPDHMHGAIMYSKHFKFFDPAHEGIIRAMRRDLARYTLCDISWGAITETIIDLTTGKPALYDPGEQIHYVSDKMRKYFESPGYKNIMMKYYEKKKYFFDYEEMIKKREEILKFKRIEDL